jgi:hypothetical protein
MRLTICSQGNTQGSLVKKSGNEIEKQQKREDDDPR